MGTEGRQVVQAHWPVGGVPAFDSLAVLFRCDVLSAGRGGAGGDEPLAVAMPCANPCLGRRSAGHGARRGENFRGILSPRRQPTSAPFRGGTAARENRRKPSRGTSSHGEKVGPRRVGSTPWAIATLRRVALCPRVS